MTPGLHRHDVDVPVLFLRLFLITDAIIIALDLVNWFGGMKINFLTIGRDQALGEAHEYLKLTWAIILSAWLAFRSDRLGYLVWSLVFFGFLADDSLTVHENMGRYFANTLSSNPAFGLPKQFFGELIAMAGEASILVLLLAAGYFSSDKQVRSVYRRWVPLVGALAFFGVAVDFLHGFAIGSPVADRIVTLIEDGGEMIVISFITASVLDVFCNMPVVPNDKTYQRK